MRFQIFLSITLLGSIVSNAIADSGARLYERGRSEYLSAKKMPEGYSRDRALKNAASTLRKFVETHKEHSKAPDALFDLGSIYKAIAISSDDRNSASTAIHYFKEVVQRSPKGPLADDSLFEVAKLCMKVFQDTQCSEEALQKIHSEYREGDVAGQLATQREGIPTNKSSPDTLAEVKGVVFDREAPGLLVRVQLSDRRPFVSKMLASDSSLGLPERYYVDLEKSHLNDATRTLNLAADDPISQIRFGQNGNSVRVVFDMKPAFAASKVTAKIEGSDLVIQVPGNEAPMQIVVQPPDPPQEIAPAPVQTPKKEIREKFRLVIDAGHGGEDTGAVGKRGTMEKDICLSISRRVIELLRGRPEYEVFITRPEDRYITLSDRTKFANSVNGNLFVSIHANASPRRAAEGISTYFLNNHDDAESLRVATRENSEPLLSVAPDSPTSENQYLEIMKASMEKNFHTVQSTEFARLVQTAILKDLRSEFDGVQDLGVKSARFYVLTGAMMPAILVETSFISNPKEEKRLKDAKYQKLIARSIVRGIELYYKSSVGRGDHAALYQ
jgi:N-acetylmuramoyl-L-alanine amidase